MESFKSFVSSIESNSALKEEAKGLGGSPSPDQIVAFGAKHGHSFTTDEVWEYRKSRQGELSSDTLENVTGGNGGSWGGDDDDDMNGWGTTWI